MLLSSPHQLLSCYISNDLYVQPFPVQATIQGPATVFSVSVRLSSAGSGSD
ncbi:MAG: hypothetical protein WBB35_00100 [Saprospiraceae bacterium]